MTKIILEIKDCRGCPNVRADRTQGAGYALDYFCASMDNKKICGYVEWESDMAPVPDWCPARADVLRDEDVVI